ncbi:magnesium/cobalt transporter CorA [Desulfovibrio ferrophilus]|uniref:Magnesium transport protein CorA n=1 Tax=Desulfovibrio ferrophilus TaxID=241368 RepID=A0A2Z6B0P7_9BACT|nr:magnesium/cobalt transporter CorA [Desulfovibrio ferrophilus]BBD08976.1 magnesium and cobalt transport protein CorA [Desulfovibrio ferrophilus]
MLEYLNLKLFTGRRGAPPGTLEYSGKEREFSPYLNHFAYSSDGLVEQAYNPMGPAPDLSDGRVHFLSLTGVHEADVVKSLGAWGGAHPLMMEDILNTGQRPKLNEQDGVFFATLRNVDYDLETKRIQEEQVSLLWSEQHLLAFQESEQDAWAPVIERLRKGGKRIRSGGVDYLVVALMDSLVDGAMEALSLLTVEVQELESTLARKPEEQALLEVYRVRRDCILLLRNVLLPTHEVLSSLKRNEVFAASAEAVHYLGDVLEHALHGTEAAKVLHDILGGMMDVHISLAGMRMNNVMKVLTIVATIFIPLTFIAGIYGMNFKIMPELEWAWGYPAALGLMLAVALGMVWYFMRKRWF